jgi:hypothetical protein
LDGNSSNEWINEFENRIAKYNQLIIFKIKDFGVVIDTPFSKY